MNRLALSLIVLMVGAVLAPAGEAVPVRTAGGGLMSCPDPSVLDARYGLYRYYLVCTSDYDPDAFPIRGSNDLVHWSQIGDVFPSGHQPWWALPSPAGRYWAPSIYRIQNRWVVYFAAQYNPGALTLRRPTGARLPYGDLVIGVASSSSLRGPWQTKVLHYRSQFNGVNHEHENYGGVIDPSVVRDVKTHQLYLFWAEQHSSIWAGKLSSNGLNLDSHIHQTFWAHPGWECRTPSRTCVVEGPEEMYRDGWFYLFYSGASTWDGTYAVGVATSSNPLEHVFVNLSPSPILQSGHGWIAPGGSAAPVAGPNGRYYLLYHASTSLNPFHVSAARYLFVSPIAWTGVGGYYPLVNDGHPG